MNTKKIIALLLCFFAGASAFAMEPDHNMVSTHIQGPVAKHTKVALQSAGKEIPSLKNLITKKLIGNTKQREGAWDDFIREQKIDYIVAHLKMLPVELCVPLAKKIIKRTAQMKAGLRQKDRTVDLVVQLNKNLFEYEREQGELIQCVKEQNAVNYFIRRIQQCKNVDEFNSFMRFLAGDDCWLMNLEQNEWEGHCWLNWLYTLLARVRVDDFHLQLLSFLEHVTPHYQCSVKGCDCFEMALAECFYWGNTCVLEHLTSFDSVRIMLVRVFGFSFLTNAVVGEGFFNDPDFFPMVLKIAKDCDLDINFGGLIDTMLCKVPIAIEKYYDTYRSEKDEIPSTLIKNINLLIESGANIDVVDHDVGTMRDFLQELNNKVTRGELKVVEFD